MLVAPARFLFAADGKIIVEAAEGSADTGTVSLGCRA
jgi:hypothetical protein